MNPLGRGGVFFGLIGLMDPFLFLIRIYQYRMEKGPFIDGLPIKNGDFPWLC